MTAPVPYVIPQELIALHTALMGMSGSGKTFTSKGYVERLLQDGRRVCIVDPVGHWWGIRYKAAGGLGFAMPHVGGQWGDHEIALEDAEAIAQYVGAGDGSMIIDLSEMMIDERHKFALQFFMHLFKANTRPLYLVLEEADEFAPQNPLPETRRLLHHVDRIARRGRARGFRLTAITQRPAVLNKNVLSQCGTLIAMRLTASQDRDAVKAWIKGQADLETGQRVLSELPRLKTGNGFVWSPANDVLDLAHFPKITTVDSSRTPKDDEPPLEPDEDLHETLRGKYSKLYEQLHDPETDDEPAAPRVRSKRAIAMPGAANIEALKEQGYHVLTPEQLSREHETERRHGFEQGFAAASSTITAKVQGVIAKADEFVSELREISRALAAEIINGEAIAKAAVAAVQANTTGPGTSMEQLAREHDGVRYKSAREQLTLGHDKNKALQALAMRHPIKLSKSEIAATAGMAPRGGGFLAQMRQLREHELIEQDGKLYGLTARGMRIAGDMIDSQPRTTGELVGMWEKKLPGAKGGPALRLLIRLHPEGISSAQLAEQLEMSARGGAFLALMRHLRRAGLVESHKGGVRASAVLFP